MQFLVARCKPCRVCMLLWPGTGACPGWARARQRSTARVSLGCAGLGGLTSSHPARLASTVAPVRRAGRQCPVDGATAAISHLGFPPISHLGFPPSPSCLGIFPFASDSQPAPHACSGPCFTLLPPPGARWLAGGWLHHRSGRPEGLPFTLQNLRVPSKGARGAEGGSPTPLLPAGELAHLPPALACLGPRTADGATAEGGEPGFWPVHLPGWLSSG